MKAIKVTLLLLAFAWTASAAQIKVDKSLPASPEGEVYIGNMFGSVEVIGWDAAEVSVTGTLAAAADDFDFDGDPEEGEIWIEVGVPDSPSYDGDFESHIVVKVPRGSSVGVETINASIDIAEVSGLIEIETVNGSITINGDPRGVEISAITAEIDITAVNAPMEIESVSGGVTLRGVTSAVSVESVSGNVDISGQDLSEVEIESMAGDIRIQGNFTAKGDVDIESFSGNVELVFPSGIAANFDLVTFSGKIENAFGPKPRRGSEHEPYMELSFSTGLDSDFDVSVETFSGNITITAN